jgi:eukaryotic-like serine/threonine-protein kinase
VEDLVRAPGRNASRFPSESRLDAAALHHEPIISPHCRVRLAHCFGRLRSEEQEIMTLKSGTFLDGKYRIVKRLGTGSMGEVHLGENVRLGKLVAIKVLMWPEDAELRVRFEREARAAARIRSPHVVDVMDLGETPDGQPYMVMTYLEGESLAERLTRMGKLPQEDVIAMAIDLLDGLSAVHEAGVIHRDVKPENVFLARDGEGERLSLVDFGLAVTAEERLDSGGIEGTPWYMSPEQARAENQRVDARSDLYSVAVMIYEALAGRLPFTAEDPDDVLLQIAGEMPPALESLVPGVDPELAHIVRRGMSRHPDMRFQSAREMQRALLELRSSRMTPAEIVDRPSNGRLSASPVVISIPPPAFSTPTASLTSSDRRRRSRVPSPVILMMGAAAAVTLGAVATSRPDLLAKLDPSRRMAPTTMAVVPVRETVQEAPATVPPLASPQEQRPATREPPRVERQKLVRITSRPDGARVIRTRDGAELCAATPCSILLEGKDALPGTRYLVQIFKPGFRLAAPTVTSDVDAVHVPLTRAPGAGYAAPGNKTRAQDDKPAPTRSRDVFEDRL